MSGSRAGAWVSPPASGSTRTSPSKGHEASGRSSLSGEEVPHSEVSLGTDDPVGKENRGAACPLELGPSSGGSAGVQRLTGSRWTLLPRSSQCSPQHEPQSAAGPCLSLGGAEAHDGGLLRPPRPQPSGSRASTVRAFLGLLGAVPGPPWALPLWLPRVEFCFLFGRKEPEWESPEPPDDQSDSPLSSKPGLRCPQTEQAGGGGSATSQSGLGQGFLPLFLALQAPKACFHQNPMF